MPSLKLCHRRWSFASDDLLIPACLLIFLHSLCLLCLIAVGILHFFVGAANNCETERLPSHQNDTSTISNQNSSSILEIFCPVYTYPALISLCTIILLGALLLEVAVAYYSSRGTIMHAGPRQRMVPFLGTRFVFISAEICFVAFSYVWFYGCPCIRNSAVSVLLLAIAVSENVVVVLLPLFAICSYDVSGAKWYRLQKAVGAATATTMSSLNRNTSSVLQPGERAKISHTKRRLVVARQAKEAYARSWFKQFNCLFCCLGSERRAQQTTFVEVANLFGELFGDTDLVGSDLIAGLVLLRRAQKRVMRLSATKRLQMLSGVPVTFQFEDEDDEDVSPPENQVSSRPTSKAMLDPDQNQCDAQLVLQIVRIFKFAHSATGWPFYVLRHPGFIFSGPLSSCHCCKSDSPLSNANILNDNLCKLNTQAVLRLTQVPASDFVYADFESAIEETAFIVLLDAQLKAVVVSVRGTLSLSDILTDLNADSAKIPVDEETSQASSDDGNWLAHRGMLTAAISLRDRLVNEKILEKAFLEADRLYGGQEKSAGFSLVLVGHSLGAGVATLLGILLKRFYPDLRVFAFSPPGGLLGVAAARFTQSFVTSVILGKDIVPRIGLRQIEALRADIVNVLKSCNQPKWSVIGNAAISCCFPGSNDNRKMVTDENHPNFLTIKTMRNSVAMTAEEIESESITPDIEFGQNDEFFQQQKEETQPSDRLLSRQEILARHTSSNASHVMGLRTHHHPLQLPGSIYHIVRQWRPPRNGKEKGFVELKVVKTSRSVYDHVLVSPRMLADHMPNGFMDALEALVKQHKLDMKNLAPLKK